MNKSNMSSKQSKPFSVNWPQYDSWYIKVKWRECMTIVDAMVEGLKISRTQAKILINQGAVILGRYDPK